MCNSGIRGAVVVTATWVLATGVPSGTVAQDLDSLAQRIDELTAEWMEVYRVANEIDSVQAFADSLERMNQRLDSVLAGSLLVTTDPSTTQLIAPHVQETWQNISARGGAATLVSGTPFRIHVTGMRVQDRPRVYRTETRVTISTNRVAGIAAETAEHSDELDETIRLALTRAVSRHLTELIPPVVVAWAGPIGPWVEDSDMRRSYLDLVGNRTTAARACWHRDYDVCRVALGLQPSDDPLGDWFNERDRRELVAETMSWFEPADRVVREMRDRCLDGSDPDGCFTLLRQQGYGSSPLSQLHRTEVTLTALRMGGSASFARLVSSSGSMVERLERTAGVPLDDVLARWLDDVEAAAGTPVRVTFRTGLTTLLWTIVFMFAATRSSRWRSN